MTEKINQIWREAKLKVAEKKSAQTLVDAAQRSIGCTNGLNVARIEISILLEDYEKLQKRLEQIVELIRKVPNAEN